MILYPNGGALILAGDIRTLLANSELHLFKAISQPISVSTVIGDLTEADYDGYLAKTIAAWLPPYLDPAGGSSIQSGTQQFDFAAVPAVTNVVLGFYLLVAAGDLLLVGTFDSPIPMTQNGDSIPVNLTLNFGASPA